MKIVRHLITLGVISALGAGIACKKPEAQPAPVQNDAAKQSAEEAARKAAEEAARKAAEEAARLKAEEEARIKAAEDARRAEEARKLDAYKQAVEAALKEINFDFDKYSIREADKPKLQAIAEFLKAYPQAKLQIEGHCDERGTVEYNQALGERRAAATKQYLVGLGVTEDRLSIISYGKERLKVQGSNEESWLANRRCEFQ